MNRTLLVGILLGTIGTAVNLSLTGFQPLPAAIAFLGGILIGVGVSKSRR